MASNVKNAIMAAGACVILSIRDVKSKRRFWVRPLLKSREKYSGTALLTGRDDTDPFTGDIQCSVCKMASNVEDAIMAAGACVILSRRSRRDVKSKRRFWVRPLLKSREKYIGTALLTARDNTDPFTGDIQCSVCKMASNVEDAIMAAGACVILSRRSRRDVKSKRRFWVRPLLKSREKYIGTALLTARDNTDPFTGDIQW